MKIIDSHETIAYSPAEQRGLSDLVHRSFKYENNIVGRMGAVWRKLQRLFIVNCN